MHPLRGVSLSLGGLSCTHVIGWVLTAYLKSYQPAFSSIFTSTVEEDESAMPKKDSRLLLAKFNDQMEKLYELLRAVEDIRLAPEVRR